MKLTTNQKLVLELFEDGKPHSVTASKLTTARRLETRGLLRHVWFYLFEITDAGRSALQEGEG